jgi:site-specific recombinase XerD
MKSLPIRSSHYHYLLEAYREYLQILGYAAATVQSWPVHVRELLHYLEQQQVPEITFVQSGTIDDFLYHIKRRSNQRRAGVALSGNHINSIINAVNVFARFLNSTGKYILDITPDRESSDTAERSVLTIAEVKQLYEATFLPYRENSLALGQRDRAIIAVLYGCGLRRSEGLALNITDVDLVQKRLFVRKGKGNKQRYVPIAAVHASDLQSYLQEGRDWFLYGHGTVALWHSHRHGRPLTQKEDSDHSAFFISQSGRRIDKFYQRLGVMRERAGIEKVVTPHGLRHSIATHLLQNGMDIEEIAKFLGHASLVSTQIYTHLVNRFTDETANVF